MKRLVTVFERATYLSGASGAPKNYLHDESLCDVLGQAKLIRVQVVGNSTSGANARASVLAFEGSDPTARPSEVGSQIGTTQVIDNDLRPPMFNVVGPFSGRVDLVLEISDKNGVPGNDQTYDLAMHVTLILEE